MSLEAFMYSEPYFWRADIFESATSRRNKKKKAEREAKGISETKPVLPEDAPQWTMEENIRHGIEAMNVVRNSHTDVQHAMYRNDIGWISFPWGTPGQAPPADLKKWWDSLSSETERRAAPYKSGYGVSHIIAKRDWEGKHIKALLGQKGKDFVMSLVEVIARGKKRAEGTRVILELVPKHIKVVLEKISEPNITEGKSAENWLISSYEILTSGNYQLVEDSGR